MATRPVIIGTEESKAIADLRRLASAEPLNAMEVAITATIDREAHFQRMAALTIKIPVGFSVTYSHELQPHAPGHRLCHHLSISIDKAGKVPSPQAVELLLSCFGMASLVGSDHVWIERVDEETQAVNVVQLMRDTLQ